MSLWKKIKRKLSSIKLVRKIYRYSILLPFDNNVAYKLSIDNTQIKLQVFKRFPKSQLYFNDTLVTSNGEYSLFSTTYEFTYDDVIKLEGKVKKIIISTNGKSYFPVSLLGEVKDNYNNIKGIFYCEDYIHYFRNTARYKGRLVMQRKPRESYEDEHHYEMIKTALKCAQNQAMKYVVFYEKFGTNYEESASKVFERVAHYDNVYYILNKNSKKYNEISAKFPGKIISRDEQRYFEIIFRAKYLIGTEVPMHIGGLGTPYPEVRSELMDTSKHKFIFLQHGVMYALSLKSSGRNFFKKGDIHDPYKVIVSSNLEADHLKQYGGFSDGDIWKTGLASFDNKKINDNAYKTTIMLTWRPWDEMFDTFEETSYYTAVKSIIDNIEEKSNISIIFHPKVIETISPTNELLKYKSVQSISNELNETKILITDYSSVSFDAYNRGSDVIFWWVEIDECLQKYNNHLMLNEQNIFGPIIYNNSQINKVINDVKKNSRTCEYEQKFTKIVEFSDNNNTSRIIKKLEEENMFR